VPGVYIASEATDQYTGATIDLGNDASQWPWSTSGDNGVLAFTPVKGATYHMTFNVTSTGTSGFRIRWMKDNAYDNHTKADADSVSSHVYTADQTANFIPAYFQNTIDSGETKTYTVNFTMDGNQVAEGLIGNLAIRGQQGNHAFVINTLQITDNTGNMLVNYKNYPVLNFESDALGKTYPVIAYGPGDINAVVEANPDPTGQGQSLHVTNTAWNAFPKFSVTLPEGKTLANVEKITFDMYFVSVDQTAGDQIPNSYKVFNYFIGATGTSFSPGNPTADTGYIIADPADNPVKTWLSKEFVPTIPDSLLKKSQFDFGMGLQIDQGNYFLDNITFVLQDQILVTGIGLDTVNIKLNVGDSIQVTATVIPNQATDKSLSWSSDHPEIASVSANGMITGVSAGSAKITAAANDNSGVTKDCFVTVSAVPVTGVVLDTTALELVVGDTHTLKATVLPPNATNKSVTWGSSDPTVATVSDGLVTAIAAGDAAITVFTADSIFNATCNVTVSAITDSVTAIRLDTTTLELVIGDTHQLQATVEPDNATNKNLTWSSDNESIATVSQDGLITAVGEGGPVTITATAADGSGIFAICTVTVSPILVTDISFDKDAVDLFAGGTYQLDVTVAPDDATDKSLTWESDDQSVATVSDDGLITAVDAGTATISATANDGSGIQAICTVTVKTTGEGEGIIMDFSEITQKDNNSTQQGWQTIASIMDKVAEAKYLVIETEGVGDNKDGFGGIDLIVQGGDGVNPNLGWTQVGLINSGWLTYPREDGKTVSIVIDLQNVLGANYYRFLQCTNWAQLFIQYSPSAASGLTTAFEGLGVTNVYLTGDIPEPADAVELTGGTGYGFIFNGSVNGEQPQGNVAVTGVSLNLKSITMQSGDNVQLTATISPTNATDKNVSWSSSDETVATVSDAGLVTAVGEGTATITVTTEDGELTETCDVTVVNDQTTAEGVIMDFSGIPQEDNAPRQQGWKQIAPIMDKVAEAKYLVIETEGVGDNKDGFGGIDLIVQGGDGVNPNLGWTQVALINSGWLSYPREDGKTVSIAIDLKNVLGANYYNFIQCTSWAQLFIQYYPSDASGLTTAFAGLGLTNVYLTGDINKPADAVDLTGGTNYGFIFNGSVNGEQPQGTVAVTGVSLDQESITMQPGDNVQLTATVAPTNATDKNVSWSSNDETVATVSDAGLVTAIGEGTAIITVTTEDGELTAACNVSVATDQTTAEGVIMDFSQLPDGSNNNTQQGWLVNGILDSIASAKYFVIETEGVGDNPGGFGGIQFIFQGNNGDPATITVDWTQVALNGNWVSFPRADGKTVSIAVNIKNAMGGKYDDFIQCTSWSRILIGYYGGTSAYDGLGLKNVYLTGDIDKPADAVDLAANYGFIFAGSVTGEQPGGTVAITGISLDQDSLSIKTADRIQLTATVTPSDATNKNVIWSSSDSTIVTVSNSGLVIGVGEGTATITATTEDGSFTAKCNVEVSLRDIEVNEEAKVGADGIGKMVLSLTIPANTLFSGSFLLTLPNGIQLNEDSTRLAGDLDSLLSLTITQESDSTWTFTIAPLGLRNAKEELVYTKIVEIGYTIDKTIITAGEHEALINDLSFEFENGTTIVDDGLPVIITVLEAPTNIQRISGETLAYMSNGWLYIESPIAETVRVYSLNGVLHYNFQKPAGYMNYSIKQSKGTILIVKGSSGWAKKLIMN